MKRKKKNKRGSNINDFLKIRSIDNGIIKYENNMYAVVMRLGSLNLTLLDSEEQKVKINQFSSILSSLQWDCSIIKVERPMDLSGYIKKQKDLLKKQHVKYKEKEMNEEGYNQRLKQINLEKNLLTDYSENTPVLTNEFYIMMYGNSIEDLIYSYNNSFERFEQIKLEPKKCSNAQIKSLIYVLYNPLGEKTTSDFLDEENYKQDILPEYLQFYSKKFKSDTMEACVHNVYDFPMNAGASWLAPLMNIPSTTCVINIKSVSTQQARGLMDKAITEVRTQLLSKSTSSESISKQAQLESFLYILEEIERGNEVLKQTNILIMGYSKEPNELKVISKNIVSSVKQYSMKVDKLAFRQIEGYIGVLPTPRDDIMIQNGRDMPSLSLAAGFPFVFQALEDTTGFLLGYNRTNLIFFDPRGRSSSRTNSNIMVIGKSGSGKSHFTKKMMLKLLLEGVKVCIVDPEGEYDILTKRLGGQTIDVGAATDSRINPFHIFGQLQEDGEEDDLMKSEKGLQAIFSTQIQFLEQFFQSLIPDLTNKELSRLSSFIIETYKSKKIQPSTKFEDLKAKDYPIIDDLIAIIEKKIKQLNLKVEEDSKRVSDIGDELKDLRNIKVYLARLGSGGSLDNLWNGETTIDVKNSDLIHFDFRKMTNSKNELVMNAQMMLVLRFLENEVSKNRERNKAKKENNYIAIAIDEAHVFIDERSPAALYFMFQMVKRIRKYNGIFITITQNVNDFVGSYNIRKYTTAIINGSQYSFIFGLNPADLQALVDLYRSVGGFSSEERSFIGNAGVGQCLFVVSPGQRITMEKITISKEEEKAFA